MEENRKIMRDSKEEDFAVKIKGRGQGRVGSLGRLGGGGKQRGD